MAHVGKVSMDEERQLGSCDHEATLSDLGRGDTGEGYGYCVIDNPSGGSLRCKSCRTGCIFTTCNLPWHLNT